MSAPVLVVGVVGDVIVMIAVAATLARNAFSAPKRAALLILALVCAWFLSMVLESLRAPVWLLLLTGAVILLNVTALAATVHLATTDRPGVDPSDGHGGRGRPRPENPGRDGGGGEPSWWPEFERQLAGYVAEAEHSATPAMSRSTSSSLL